VETVTRGPVTEARAFSYRNSIAPMMWMLIGISIVEALAVHFLLWLWSPLVAGILTLLTLGFVAWLVRLLLSFKRLPVLVGAQGVTMRVGTLRCVHVPVEQLDTLRRNFAEHDLKQPDVLNLALLAYPNVLLDIHPPLIGKRRPIGTVAHRIDDHAGFAAAVDALLAGSATR
jgi:hypothetical protein